jgi:hypothetical protein
MLCIRRSRTFLFLHEAKARRLVYWTTLRKGALLVSIGTEILGEASNIRIPCPDSLGSEIGWVVPF